jgi:rhamnose transport system ATP-binding protein|tara:strand:+ start:1713 stop:3191 length:1479 start_codon:yes stop_codon:yes gene_type:complete
MNLQLKKVSKFFPGIKALDKVDFNLKRNSVHALVGENGAGKSTLVKILTGIYKPDEGDVFLNKKKINLFNPKVALKNSISVIHQETVMFENLTVMENIFVGKQILKKKIFIDWNEIEISSKKILNFLKSEISPHEKVKNLSIAQRHIIEIARSLMQNSKIIIMDEPTAALSQKEIDQLFKIIQDLKKKNKSIIFISHKLDEIFEICDEFSVLRDGQLIISDEIKKFSKKKIISKMVGREINDIYPKQKVKIGNQILIIENLSKKNQFKNINFNLNKREILGFYGLVGSGRSEVMKSIFSINNFDNGKISYNNDLCKFKNPIDAINKGIVYLTEERKDFGIVGNMSIKDNLTLSILEKISLYGILDTKKQFNIAEKLKKELNIKFSHSEQIIDNISGGNQQKIVIGKWLNTDPKIIILDEPTRGIDIASKSTIHRFMGNLVNKGMSIILVSSDLPEVMGMCDRVVVMYKGLIKKTLDVSRTSSEEIISYATGE